MEGSLGGSPDSGLSSLPCLVFRGRPSGCRVGWFGRRRVLCGSRVSMVQENGWMSDVGTRALTSTRTDDLKSRADHGPIS
jgi:hypothetical protein